jgi:hypothetical protein
MLPRKLMVSPDRYVWFTNDQRVLPAFATIPGSGEQVKAIAVAWRELLNEDKTPYGEGR